MLASCALAELLQNASLANRHLLGTQDNARAQRAAIVKVQHHLMGRDVSPQVNIAHDLAGRCAGLSLADLPADDFPAKYIQK